LAGFYFFLYEYNVEGILYYNGTLSKRVIDLNTKIKFINIPFNNQTIDVNINVNIINNITPRQYQSEAIEILSIGTNSILSLPCGMGKTFIASLIGQKYDNIIVLSPLRVLAQELLKNIYNYTDHKYNKILLSKDGVLKVDDVKKYLKTKNIISSTYESVSVLNEVYHLLNNCIIIIDEYHNISKNNLTNANNCIYKLINNSDKKLYLSATPNMEIKYDNIYNYKWQDAIYNKYICDFDIIIPESNNNVEYMANILNLENTFDKKQITKIYFLLKSILYFGNKKCIIYVRTIKEAHKYNTIIEWLSKLLNIHLNKNVINCKTSRKKRKEYLELFENSKIISILINVHILDEGINIVNCDSVFICNPNNNINNIIQRMCRCNRITNTKTKCYIYLWTNNNKVDKILNHIFGLTNNEINNKVIKYNCVKNKIGQIDNTIKNNNLADLSNNNLTDSTNNNLADLSNNKSTNGHNLMKFKEFIIKNSSIDRYIELDISL
jgi:superfamily II DNA or RNA helicase